VVSAADEADAVLTGTTDDHQGAFRLVGKANQILWIGEGVYKANKLTAQFVATNITSQVASKAVNSLLKAVQKAQKAKH
jgi:hypothetical protein